MNKLLLSAGLALALFVHPAVSAAAPTPPSAHDFARAPAIDSVSVSPDGKHIAALTSPDGDKLLLTVWKTDALTEKPVLVGSTHMRFLEVRFLKNDRLLITATQPLTVGHTRGHIAKSYVTDLEGSFFRPLLPEARAGQSSDEQFVDKLRDAELVSSLPQDPQNVMVVDQRLEGEGDVYRVNVYTGSAERVERGSERFFDPQPDLKGEVRAKTELNYDGGKVYLAVWIKDPDTGKWEEHFRSYAKDRVITSIVGFSPDPHVVYVNTLRPGSDKRAIYEYDIKQRKLLEPLFAHRMFEADDVLASREKAEFGRPLGFSYQAETIKQYWADEKLAATAAGVRQALADPQTTIDWVDPGGAGEAKIPVATDVVTRLANWSDDRSVIIVSRRGPKVPGDYYILTGGSKLTLLGQARPWIDSKALGDTRLVEYRARDGLMIPAYLTTPRKDVFGPGPYPTLIEPHGGPWARDYLSWDIAGWVQYFASRGFAVLEPQFRGSEDWGQKLWRAGDGEWGQKMQDDKDDGVKWLVDQKIADPNRVAMFGYSYGGYAALAASIRPNGLYQCAISGAGAGDLDKISRATFDNRFQREFQHPTIKGLDALAHAKEAQIPVFLYHGDRDQTVDVEESKKFAAALKAAGKPYKLTIIPDMGHQFIFMTPAMVEQQLVEVDDFLKTGCKPGGL